MGLKCFFNLEKISSYNLWFLMHRLVEERQVRYPIKCPMFQYFLGCQLHGMTFSQLFYDGSGGAMTPDRLFGGRESLVACCAAKLTED